MIDHRANAASRPPVLVVVPAPAVVTINDQIAVRTVRKLYNAIAKAIDAVTVEDCLNCFRNSGYVA